VISLLLAALVKPATADAQFELAVDELSDAEAQFAAGRNRSF
jgi:hypothetical protein